MLLGWDGMGWDDSMVSTLAGNDSSDVDGCTLAWGAWGKGGDGGGSE